MAKSLMKFIAKAVVPLLWLVGLLILILACVAISKIQNPFVLHMVIVIIVFTLFMAALGGLLHFASAQSSADEYDVEKQTKGVGKENRAYVSEGGAPAAGSTRPTSSAGGKWANNYVPYGDFPQGSKEDVVNGTNGGLEKGDSEKNGSGEKWRNSYVPYEEEYNNQ